MRGLLTVYYDTALGNEGLMAKIKLDSFQKLKKTHIGKEQFPSQSKVSAINRVAQTLLLVSEEKVRYKKLCDNLLLKYFFDFHCFLDAVRGQQFARCVCSLRTLWNIRCFHDMSQYEGVTEAKTLKNFSATSRIFLQFHNNSFLKNLLPALDSPFLKKYYLWRTLSGLWVIITETKSEILKLEVFLTFLHQEIEASFHFDCFKNSTAIFYIITISCPSRVIAAIGQIIRWTQRIFLYPHYIPFYPIFRGYMFFLSPRHSAFPDFMQSLKIFIFFWRQYTNFFSHVCSLPSDMLNISLRALVSNSFLSWLKTGSLWFKWLNNRLGASFSKYENPKAKYWSPGVVFSSIARNHFLKS